MYCVFARVFRVHAGTEDLSHSDHQRGLKQILNRHYWAFGCTPIKIVRMFVLTVFVCLILWVAPPWCREGANCRSGDTRLACSRSCSDPSYAPFLTPLNAITSSALEFSCIVWFMMTDILPKYLLYGKTFFSNRPMTARTLVLALYFLLCVLSAVWPQQLFFRQFLRPVYVILYSRRLRGMFRDVLVSLPAIMDVLMLTVVRCFYLCAQSVFDS